jgi:1-acyl-sn-glycerol-3-phosphate acyltransferase
VRTPVLDCCRLLVWLIGRAYFGVSFHGTQHIPLTGPLVIASNHVSYADPALLSLPVRRPIFYMAMAPLFQIPVFGWLLRRFRAFPVQLESADPRAMREAVRLLQAGEALLIFPEGGRASDGRLQRFKPGAFRLACSLGAPVLPVTITGGYEAWPPHRVFPRPGRITITYHSLVKGETEGDLREAAQELAERTRAAIASALSPHQRPAADR